MAAQMQATSADIHAHRILILDFGAQYTQLIARRVREIGVRMALGASPASVVLLVLRQGFRPIFLGLVVGMIGAVFTAFALRNLLFGVQPLDLATFAVIPLVLTAFALLACWLPARKAARVNPLEALRAE